MIKTPVTVWARAWILLLKIAPLRAYTALMRVLGQVPVPGTLRGPILGSIAAAMDMNLDEAEKSIQDYRTFHDVFVRRLKPASRTVDPDPRAIISPVDGQVIAFGPITSGSLIQAKGIYYRAQTLIGDDQDLGCFEEGSFITLYLSPKDYHRIHCPSDGRIQDAQIIGGRLFPVTPTLVQNMSGLYLLNERLVVHLDTPPFGRSIVVCVAAAGVGTISASFSDTGALMNKGDELAAFHLGSTVIVLFEKACVNFVNLHMGQHVKMGHAIAHWRQRERDETSQQGG